MMRSPVYLIILILITGCTYSASHVKRGLDEAEMLLPGDPGAALKRLNEFDVSAFDDSALMARWALLYSEAMVANRITAPTDTIVNIAIDYYSRHNFDEQSRHASRLKVLLRSQGDDDELARAIYLQKEREFMLYRERIKREQSVFVALVLILTAIGVIVWQRQRLKLKDAQNETLIAEASSLMEGLSQNESLCCDLQSRLKGMLANRFDVIDRLCETYFESQGTKVERKAIVEEVKSQIEELKSDSGLFAEMERCVNDCHDNLLDRLREAWPSIKPDDYRLAVYLSCKLSSRSIAALTGESIDVIYKRKSRLKARIAAIDGDGAGGFMSIFS